MSLQRRFIPDIKVLLTFECAARHGNFTRAAEDLSLTQSAVSRQIRDLEEQIGRPLFERVRGKVVLTGAGEDFLPDVRRLLKMAEATIRQATSSAETEKVLAINVLPTFAARWLVPRLPSFLDANKDLRLDISTALDVFNLDERQCDLAIHFGKPIWPGGHCSYLCSEIVLPVAGGALRSYAGAPPQVVADLPKVHLTDRPDLWTDWIARQGLETHSDGGHWFDQFSLTIEAVKAGMGCALLPLYLIESEISSGELVVIADVPLSTDMAYYMVTPEGRVDETKAFRDWLIGQVNFRPLAR